MMNMRWLFRPLGCFFVLILVPFAVPILLIFLAIKVLTYVTRDTGAFEPSRARTHSSRGNRVRNKQAHPFAGFRFTRNEPTERKMDRHVRHLSSEIGEALEHNTRVSPDKTASLKRQTQEATDYVLASLARLVRIRRRKAMVSAKKRAELEQIENRLWLEIKRSLDMLEEALVSIITVDVVGGEGRIERLLDELHESNARLRDIADAHQEIRTAGKVWLGEIG
jgi:hypothetical protein